MPKGKTKRGQIRKIQQIGKIIKKKKELKGTDMG